MSSTARTVADNVRRLRVARGLSLRALAAELTRAGRPLSADALNKIENGRTLEPGAEEPKQIRRVDVDDLVGLALALRVSPLALLMPWAGTPNTPAEITGAVTASAREAWQWADGEKPLNPSEADPYGDILRFRLDSRPAWARGPLADRYNEILTDAVARGAMFEGRGRMEFEDNGISVYDADGRLVHRDDLTKSRGRSAEVDQAGESGDQKQEG